MSLSAGADSSSSSSTSVKQDTARYGKLDKDRFSDARILIIQQKFHEAYLLLLSVISKSEDEADRQNLLGFTARKSDDLRKAGIHYEQALKINPTHRGALEYQGELFLRLGNTAKAKNNLNLLKAECPSGCLELRKLETAIAQF